MFISAIAASRLKKAVTQSETQRCLVIFDNKLSSHFVLCVVYTKPRAAAKTIIVVINVLKVPADISSIASTVPKAVDSNVVSIKNDVTAVIIHISTADATVETHPIRLKSILFLNRGYIATNDIIIPIIITTSPQFELSPENISENIILPISESGLADCSVPLKTNSKVPPVSMETIQTAKFGRINNAGKTSKKPPARNAR